MKWLATTCLACLGLCLGTAWWQLRAASDVAVPGRTVPAGEAANPPSDAPVSDRRLRLAEVRRTYDPEQLDRFVEEQETIVARRPDDPAALRLCAESRLERVLLRNQRRGMSVGTPMYSELPEEVAADVDAGLAHLYRARELGDESADNYRLEAALLGNRITGLGTALQWNGRIEEALARAAEADDRDPALHLTLGLRKLLAPRLLGHDPERALEHLQYAADAMSDDERPRVFAAMAAFLLRKRQQAIEWLDRAVAENPRNVFARVVRDRVRRGEPEPFGRDVSVAEATATNGR